MISEDGNFSSVCFQQKAYLEAHVLVEGVGYGGASGIFQTIPGQVEGVQGHIVHQALG